MARPLRADIPIYLAVMGPKAVAQAFEIADGWLPIFWSPEKARAAFGDVIANAREGFDIAATAPVILIDDVESGREFLKPYYALYIGGMGARGKNFYNDLACRYGYEDAAREIQDLYLDGHKRDAAAAVPDAFIDEVALVGPKERLAERLDAWRESGATSLLVSTQQPEALAGARRDRPLAGGRLPGVDEYGLDTEAELLRIASVGSDCPHLDRPRLAVARERESSVRRTTPDATPPVRSPCEIPRVRTVGVHREDVRTAVALRHQSAIDRPSGNTQAIDP